MQQDKRNSGEMWGNTNSIVEGQDGGDFGQQWVWGRTRGRRGCIGWTRWIQKETLWRENWKFGRRRDNWGGFYKGRKDHGFGLGMI